MTGSSPERVFLKFIHIVGGVKIPSFLRLYNIPLYEWDIILEVS